MAKTRQYILAVAVLTAASATASAAPTNADFINAAFNDLLNRSPSPTELSTYEAFLVTNSPQAAAYSIETSGTEFHNIVLNNLFSLLLHHAPSISAQTSFLPLFSTSTIEQVEASIAGSPEYFLDRAGNTNAGFVAAIFPDLLDRSPSPLEQSQFITLLSTDTPEQVATLLLDSTEYQNDLVTGYYQQYLHRTPTPLEAAPFLNQLQSAVRDEVVISEIIGSPEFFADTPEPASLTLLAAAPLLILRRRPQVR